MKTRFAKVGESVEFLTYEHPPTKCTGKIIEVLKDGDRGKPAKYRITPDEPRQLGGEHVKTTIRFHPSVEDGEIVQKLRSVEDVSRFEWEKEK